MRSFDLGTLFGESLAILFRNFVPFLLLGIVLYGPVIVFTNLVLANGPPPDAPQEVQMAYFPTLMADVGLLLLVQILLGMLLTAALSLAVVETLAGRKTSAGSTIVVGFRSAFRSVPVSVMRLIRIVIGSILFLIPGYLESLRLWVAVPAAVVERTGAAASLRRSIALTDGYRGTIFAFSFIVMILTVVMAFAIEHFAAQMRVPKLATLVAQGVVSLLVALWGSVAVSVGYYTLRSMRENVGGRDLASVFA